MADVISFLRTDTGKFNEGDIVQLFSGSYGTGIVKKVLDDAVVVTRVHCYIHHRQLQIGVEEISIPMERALQLARFVIDSQGRLENRSYGLY